ncbi:TPA: hypothetical protein ACS8GQ_003785 [Providencia alcalifaciens]
MEFKGTPAPWNYNENFCGTVSSSNRTMVACIYPRDNEMKANARLIAAAPELLEALIELTESAKEAIDGLGDLSDAIDTAKAAIAKALGQQ